MNRYHFDIIRPEYYEDIKAFRKEMLESGSSFDGCNMLEEYEDIEKWDLNCQLFEKRESCPPGYGIGYEYLYLCDDKVVGMVNLRPYIDDHPFLRMYGGHIGYSTRPNMRGRHYGDMMLRMFLDLCKRNFGLDRVLITCLEDNMASERIIERNGGVYEGSIFYPPEGKNIKRYWIEIR